MLTPIRLLPELVRLADRGEVLLKHYRDGCAVQTKADSSPVTIADQEAEELIEAGLRDLAPSIPMVGEEAVALGRIPEVDDAPSGWSIRSTAPRSSSSATASSRSTSP